MGPYLTSLDRFSSDLPACQAHVYVKQAMTGPHWEMRMQCPGTGYREHCMSLSETDASWMQFAGRLSPALLEHCKTQLAATES